VIQKVASNRDTQKDARALLNGLTLFQFAICLVTTSHVMAYIKPLSVLLQGRTVDIIKAHSHVDLVMRLCLVYIFVFYYHYSVNKSCIYIKSK